MSDSIAIGWLGPTNDYWNWILSHFRNVSMLDDRTVDAWLASKNPSTPQDEANVPTALLVAIESRFDPQPEFVRRIEQHAAQKSNDALRSVPFGVLLGDDWVGHRRTFPLPESLNSFYWYELYDRLLPWLLSVSQSSQTFVAQDLSAVGTNRRISPRVQRLLDADIAIADRLQNQAAVENSIQFAMVIAETASARQLWCDAFASQKTQCIATTPDHLEVWANPNLIVVDLETEPLAVREVQSSMQGVRPQEQLVQRLASQFPDSLILVTEAFPRWETWNALRECGADLIVAKPFQWTGIMDTLRNVEIG